MKNLKVGPIHAKSTNRDRRQVTDFVKIWTMGKKGWETLIGQGNFICDKPFPRYRALKNYFSLFAVRHFFAQVFFFSFSFLNATMNFYRYYVFI